MSDASFHPVTTAPEHADSGPHALSESPSSSIGQWLWGMVRSVSGARDPELFHKFVLPLIFFKRLSDVAEEARVEDPRNPSDEVPGRAGAVRREGHPEVFVIPNEFRWETLRACPPYDLNHFLTRAMHAVAELNPALRWLGSMDYADRTGGRSLEPGSLAQLIHGLGALRLGAKDVPASVLGDAFEYLLQRYAESESRVVGNFYTPRDVVAMMTHLVDAKADSGIYDPACGSGGLLVTARKFIERNNPDPETDGPALYGLELDKDISTVAKINMLLHGYSDAGVRAGNIWGQRELFGKGQQETEGFDFIITNPPWNQKPYDYGAGFYRFDDGRLFPYGVPPKSSADWGWLQHIKASLSEAGRAAVVLDTGAVTRGSDGKLASKEKHIRRAFVEEDLIEAVVLLPKNLFSGTTSPAVILLLNTSKPADCRGQILLVDISSHFMRKGRKNILTHEGMAAVSEAYRHWEAREDFSRIITLEEARETDYNLLPSHFIEPVPELQSFDKRVFISYSSKDEAFVRRLYADLKRKRIHCWFAPEDLKIGAKIRPAIDEAIQKHDKVLLVLSKHSTESDWVEQEVETALRRERVQPVTILFPISLDDEVFESQKGWPAYIQNTRNIGDFRDWGSAGKYQKAFKRLLRDLTTGE